jgi:cytochrome c oxidase cbb3-type subunit 2
MSRSTHLFTGIFGSFALSCFALVLVPQMQLGNLQPQVDEEANDRYPVDNPRQGREVYIAEGCIYCHSQQIRDLQNGTDLERGWGARRAVARDYIFERPPLIGSWRLGPDLANVGSKEWRNEDKDDPRKPRKRDAAWHYRHLYEPRAIITESNMPPYRYLFQKRAISGQRSVDAVDIPTEDGYEIVPKTEARQLVAYLLSLDRTHPLKEVRSEATSAPPAAAAPVPPAGAPAPGTPPAAAPAPGAAPATGGAPAKP